MVAVITFLVAENVANFSQDERLKAFLFGTGERVLVEASPVDKVWGIVLAKDDDRISEPQQWQGSNLLSFALMEVRALL